MSVVTRWCLQPALSYTFTLLPPCTRRSSRDFYGCRVTSYLRFCFQSCFLFFRARRLCLELRFERFCREGEVPLLPINLFRVSYEQNFFCWACLEVGLMISIVEACKEQDACAILTC